MAETIECAKDRELHEVFASLVESDRDYITTSALKDVRRLRARCARGSSQFISRITSRRTSWRQLMELTRHLSLAPYLRACV